VERVEPLQVDERRPVYPEPVPERRLEKGDRVEPVAGEECLDGIDRDRVSRAKNRVRQDEVRLRVRVVDLVRRAAPVRRERVHDHEVEPARTVHRAEVVGEEADIARAEPIPRVFLLLGEPEHGPPVEFRPPPSCRRSRGS